MVDNQMGGIAGDTPIDPNTGKPYPGGKQPVINAEVARLLEQEGVSVMDMIGGQLRDTGRLPQRPHYPMLLGYNIAEHRFYTAMIAVSLRLIAVKHGIEPIGNIEPTLLIMQALVGDIIQTPLLRYVDVEREDVQEDLQRIANLAWDSLFIDAPPSIAEKLQLIKNNEQVETNPVTILVTFSRLCADLISLVEGAATGNAMLNTPISDTINHMREIQYTDKSPMQHVYGGIVSRFERLFGAGNETR